MPCFRFLLRSLLSLLLALATLSLPVLAAPSPEEQMVRSLFESSKDFSSRFSPALLSQVPDTKLLEIIDSYLQELGAFETASGSAGVYTLIFARGEAPCRIHLSPDGKIDGLWFGLPSRHQDNLATISAQLSQLEGQVSVAITRNGSETVFVLNGDKPLAVGSTFKLYILQALRHAISQGTFSASQAISLKKEWMSLPSGILQDWPVGTPVTIETLANLMISKSDNTATDHLLFLVGREEVEKWAPKGNSPFFGTMEMFRLKHLDSSWRERYLAASESTSRLALLAEMSGLPLRVEETSDEPVAVEQIEWFMTTPELCRAIWNLRHDPALSINPGLVQKEKWHLAAYKGGSEAGVLNYTLALQKAAGSDTYCLSATINHPQKPVPGKAFDLLVSRLLSLIESGAIPGPASSSK